ncbi:MAG: dihydroorotate dehydrogenase electron transfer subunit [Spirochaetia bacterium]|nr:dihydroorotate dehydrogenase electron transfer subunit [Spirochaetia bacterium]
MKINGNVVFNKNIGDGLFRMKIDAGKSINTKPGQFINILVSESYTPLLRKPISVYDAYDRFVEIVYKVAGDGTRLLSQKKQGENIDLIGPLGNSYLDFQSQIPDNRCRIILIGGGTGAASVHFLAGCLKNYGIPFTFIQGARCKTQMVAPAEFKKLGCLFTTDDGTLGKKGYVSGLLKEKLTDNTVIYTCGPKPMLRAIRDVAKTKKNVKVFASFEEYMGCGIGACLSCVIETNEGVNKRVCKDGTVFDLDEVAF